MLTSFQSYKVCVNVLNLAYNIVLASNLNLKKDILPVYLFVLIVHKPSATKDDTPLFSDVL